jgi:hypothetical protein
MPEHAMHMALKQGCDNTSSGIGKPMSSKQHEIQVQHTAHDMKHAHIDVRRHRILANGSHEHGKHDNGQHARHLTNLFRHPKAEECSCDGRCDFHHHVSENYPCIVMASAACERLLAIHNPKYASKCMRDHIMC